MKVLSLFIVALLAAHLPPERYVAFKVVTYPSGAEVSVDGETIGISPTSCSPPNESNRELVEVNT